MASEHAREASMLAVVWVLFPFTVLILCARFYVRFVRRSIGAEDWTMLIAWCIYTAGIGTMTVLTVGHKFNHLIELENDPTHFRYLLKMEITTSAIGFFSGLFMKISVGLLLLRLLGRASKYRVWFLRINLCLYACLTVTCVGIMLGQCTPYYALWTPELLLEGKAKCDLAQISTGFNLTQSAFGAYLDFLLAFLPITIVYRLERPMKTKIALCLLLGSGIFAGACAVMKAAELLPARDSPDVTYDSYSVYLWGSLEYPFVIIAGSIPPSKPLWDFFVNGKPLINGKTRKPRKFLGTWTFWTSLRSIRSPGKDSRGSSENDNSVANSGQLDSIKDGVNVEKTITVGTAMVSPFPSPFLDLDSGWLQASHTETHAVGGLDEHDSDDIRWV